MSKLHLLTNYFEQSPTCFRQSEGIETNCISMKQFRFYCEKLHCIRSDIVQTVEKFISVKYSLFQMQHECLKKKKIVQIHLLKGVFFMNFNGRNGRVRFSSV